MIWFVLAQIVKLFIDLLLLRSQSSQQKDLQILILRQQLAILQRRNTSPVRAHRGHKLVLALLTKQLQTRFRYKRQQLSDLIIILQPDTVLRWHRDLVRRKWTQSYRRQSGRPPIDAQLQHLVVQFASDNDWGYGKIVGELHKLGFQISEQSVANILKRHGLPTLPERNASLSWKHLMSHYQSQLLACDFFTVETLMLKTLYVLFFIEVSTRRVHFAGCTDHPHQLWMTQQARQLTWQLNDRQPNIRFLIRDRDAKFCQAFDTIFLSEHIDIILTPIRAPNANAFAERWVRTVRQECLDKLIIINQQHLHQVMRAYVHYYNTARPHQGLQQHAPEGIFPLDKKGPIRCRNVLGGIIHDYYRDLA